MKHILAVLLIMSSMFMNSCAKSQSLKNVEVTQNKETIVIPIIYHCFTSTQSDKKLRDSVLKSIKQIHNELNQSFDSLIYFDTAPLVIFHDDNFNVAGLLRDVWMMGGYEFKRLINTYNMPGYYNVYIMPTEYDGLSGTLGVTPVLANPDSLEEKSPFYDVTLISYEGLVEFKSSVLIHETGHWLGLTHTFELTNDELRELGMCTIFDVCSNYMNYGCFLSQFSKGQLEEMVDYAKNYRCYLIKQ